MAASRDITNLPHDLFLLVILELRPKDCVLCRRVSRRWHAALTSRDTTLLLLRRFFPRCREARSRAAALNTFHSAAAAALGEEKPCTAPRGWCLEKHRQQDVDWSVVFALVARRYHLLMAAQPRVVEKLPMSLGPDCRFFRVATWLRFLRWDSRTAPFHYPDAMWSYSQEDGLLVYPCYSLPGRSKREEVEGEADHATADGEEDGSVYRVLDLETKNSVPVPLNMRGKVIRRVRLAAGVLVVEWAESLPYHQLNEREWVHRHFGTAFDVTRKRRQNDGNRDSDLSVEYRCEWKLHFLGLPLNDEDRFFSAHTATHYALYMWQSSRTPWGEDDPIEKLAVWDISRPTAHRPSADISDSHAQQELQVPMGSSPQAPAPDGRIYKERRPGWDRTQPTVVRRLSWTELDFYGVRQRNTPRLRELALDARNVYVVEEDHRWADGLHSSLDRPRVHHVKVTGIPVVPGSSSDERSAPGPLQGPRWVDSCGADGDVNMSFCWRAAGRRRRVGGGDESDPSPLGWPWNVTLNTAGRPSHPNYLSIQDADAGQGESHQARWLGWAPCWRHEDFPYLTVSEMVDFAAGVRITARQCFMLETLSVHVRPALCVRAPAAAMDCGSARGSLADEKTALRPRKRRERPHLDSKEEEEEVHGPAQHSGPDDRNEDHVVDDRSEEVQFADELWGELMAKGHIAGDERWIIGEDGEERITIVRF